MPDAVPGARLALAWLPVPRAQPDVPVQPVGFPDAESLPDVMPDGFPRAVQPDVPMRLDGFPDEAPLRDAVLAGSPGAVLQPHAGLAGSPHAASPPGGSLHAEAPLPDGCPDEA